MASSEEANTVITFDRSGNSRRWFSFNIDSKQWENTINQPRMDAYRDFSSVVLGDEIYIFLRRGVVMKFNYKSLRPVLHQRQSMNDARGWYTPVTQWNGSLFVTGSALRNAAFFGKSAERYYPELDRWVRIRRMNIARHYPCLVGAAGYVYCIGGLDFHHRGLTSGEKYDLRTDRWDMIPPTPRPTSYSHAACMGKDLYLVDKKGMLSFDLVTNVWSVLTFHMPWPFENWFARLVIMNHKIYCIGKREAGYSITHIDIENGNCDDLVELMADKNVWAIQTVAVKL